MREVTPEEFFATVGRLNVHPCPRGQYDLVTGYRTEWTMQDYSRRIVGISDGGTPFQANRYWLVN